MVAVTFRVSIKAPFQPQKTTESVLKGIQSGFSFIRKRGSLWQLTVLGFVSTFCGIPLLTLLPVVAKNTFHFDAKGYSYLLSISGTGSIFGALIYAGLTQRKNHGLLALRVQLMFAVLLGTFAVSRFLPLSYVCLFLGGMCLITLFASITSLVQLTVIEEMRGRVMSLYTVTLIGLPSLGALGTGAVSEWLGGVQGAPRAVLLSAVVLGIILVLVIPFFWKRNFPEN